MSDISLLIATKNRSDFLERLLRYYREVGFKGRMIIGDSSDTSHIEKIKPLVKEFQSHIDIEYREHPGESNAVCIKNLVDLVSTKYMAVLQDDDFMIPRSMDRCIEFLESHPNYVAAQGSAALFRLDSSGAYGQISLFTHFSQRPHEDETAAERLRDHFNHYTVNLFAVHRAKTYREMYEHVLALSDRSFGEELLPCCLSVIFGKHKMLNCLFLVRQGHDQQYRLPDLFDWITKHDWFSSYQEFQGCLTNELRLKDGLELDEGQKIFKQAFWGYLRRGMVRQWDSRFARPRPVVRLKRVGLRIPGVRWAWLLMLSLLPVKRNEMILPSIMRTSSPYHGDFMPVYQAVTRGHTAVPDTSDESPGILKCR